MKKIVLLILILLTSLVLFSCKKDIGDTTEYESYEYVQATKAEETSSEDIGNLQKYLKKDKSWQKNYMITYMYYNQEQESEVIKIREKKCASAFSVEYLDTGEILYYTPAGSNTDYYVIAHDNSNSVHSVLKDSKFSDLSSLFMKLSDVDPNLPKQSNVLYMYDEAVCGRNCHKYIQRAYTDTQLTQSVYVWIDTQYGFAAKCEVYNAADEMTAMWEIDEFKSGDIKDEDVLIDTSKYIFTEEVG